MQIFLNLTLKPPMLIPISTFLKLKPSHNPHTHYTNNTLTHTKPKNTHIYTVDHIFPPSSLNSEIHSQINVLTNIPKGINTTIMCYGNTGAGKTHTMFGVESDNGLVYTIGKDVIGYVASLKVLMPCSVEIASFEIYNEKVLQRGRECKIQGKTVCVENRTIETYEDFKREVIFMEKDRKTSSTALNERSSRSHTVIRLVFDVNGVLSCLHLIDLAGSEDNRKTLNTGINLKESSCINKSLFVLNSCVRAILSKSQSVPYRDSKLTRILQDSLGGTAMCYIIGCIDLEKEAEMLRTCEFISRSRKVTSNIGVFPVAESLSERIRKNKEVLKPNENIRFNKINGKTNYVRRQNYRTNYAKEMVNSDCRRSDPLKNKLNNSDEKITSCSRESGALNNKVFCNANKNDESMHIMDNSNNANNLNLNYASFSNNTGNFSSINIIKKSGRIPLSEKNTFLSPNTLSKSYKAFQSRAISHEQSGKKKLALADYRTLQKLRYCPMIETKIKTLTTKNVKKALPKDEIVNAINSGDFFKIKEIKGVGNKKAEIIVKFIKMKGEIKKIEDLIEVLGEKVVIRMANA